jgi:hypothetical protein
LNKALFKEAFGEKTMAMLFWVSSEMPPKYQDVEAQFKSFVKRKRNKVILCLPPTSDHLLRLFYAGFFLLIEVSIQFSDSFCNFNENNKSEN